MMSRITQATDAELDLDVKLYNTRQNANGMNRNP
jgi:hypothetical protein